MKDQYAGDIGDFGKYGLLRALCDGGGVRLGMAWWMTPNEARSNDGKFISYLQKGDRGLTDCDPELFDVLASLVKHKKRTVGAICESGIFPNDTFHHTALLQFPKGAQPAEKSAIRSAWLDDAKGVLGDADLIFADPDNCLSDSVDPLSQQGVKYVTPEDIRRLVDFNTSVVIYHHLNRSAKAPAQLDQAADLLQQTMGRPNGPWTLWYHRGTARGFLISPADRHRNLLRSQLDAFLSGPWGRNGHFEETS